MIPSGGRSRIVTRSDDLILLVSNPTRRIMFFSLFLLFAATMVFSLDADLDLSGSRLLRTVGYAALLLVLLGAAGWSSTTRFDRRAGSLETIAKIFGITVQCRRLARLDEIEAVVLQEVILLKETPPGGRSGVFGTLFEPQSKLIKLYLETGDERIRLDDGGSADQLEEMGIYFAQFLGVDFSKEQLQ